jgi:hypothetical protein
MGGAGEQRRADPVLLGPAAQRQLRQPPEAEEDARRHGSGDAEWTLPVEK